MTTRIGWYNSLSKPTWTPSPSTISLIRMILYPIILVSFGFVFVQAIRGKVPRRVGLPFVVKDAGPVDPQEVNTLGFMLGDKQAGPFELAIEWVKVERRDGGSHAEPAAEFTL